MSEFNFDPLGNDGNWEENNNRNEFFWKESDWRQYLRSNEREIERFLDLYERHQDQNEHLDHVAQLMGWDQVDWSISDLLGEDDSENDDEEADSGDFDPYTVHRHPVFIVTTALTRSIQDRLGGFLDAMSEASIPAGKVWQLGRALQQIHFEATIAIQCVDLGDFALAICHFKNALAQMNLAFHHLDSLGEHQSLGKLPLYRDLLVRLFDMRELWIRVMNDCRTEIESGLGGSD